MSPAHEQLITHAVIGGWFLLAAATLLVIAAVILRKQRGIHGRLMFLALLATTAPAVGPDRLLGAGFAALPSVIALVASTGAAHEFVWTAWGR